MSGSQGGPDGRGDGRGSDPSSDPVCTVRVHPLDDPLDVEARRYMLTDSDRNRPPSTARPWTQVTGNERDDRGAADLPHEQVVGWPYQTLGMLAGVCGHLRTESAEPEGSAP